MPEKKQKAPRAKKVRVAMVGAGRMANHVHYPSLASFADVEIAAISDLDPARLNETADKYGVAARYADYHSMIEKVAPDGVYVIGQPQLMYDIWIWCLEHKLNLFIEKPMGLSAHQARMLAELAEKAGVITQVDFQRRSSPLLNRARNECLKKGPVSYAVCEFYKCNPAPFWGAGGHMMDDFVHITDTVRWMCAGEIVEIDSRCRRLGTPDINFIHVVLRFDNGSTGLAVGHWNCGRRIFRVQMHAPAITAEADVEGKARVFADGDTRGAEFDCFETANGKTDWEAFGFRDKNREFIDSIKTGRDRTSSPFRDAVKTMEAVEKILAQDILRGV